MAKNNVPFLQIYNELDKKMKNPQNIISNSDYKDDFYDTKKSQKNFKKSNYRFKRFLLFLISSAMFIGAWTAPFFIIKFGVSLKPFLFIACGFCSSFAILLLDLIVYTTMSKNIIEDPLTETFVYEEKIYLTEKGIKIKKRDFWSRFVKMINLNLLIVFSYAVIFLVPGANKLMQQQNF
ncbi:hypothetical protein MHBO_004386, partial [Bonamia ostreae]